MDDDRGDEAWYVGFFVHVCPTAATPIEPLRAGGKGETHVKPATSGAVNDRTDPPRIVAFAHRLFECPQHTGARAKTGAEVGDHELQITFELHDTSDRR